MSNALREVFARFGVDFDTRGLQTGNAAVDALIGQVQNLGQMVAGAAVVQAIRSFTDEIRATGHELSNTSVALGVSTESLQVWRAAAARAGVSSEQLTPALQAIRRNATAAATTGGDMARSFRRLGVSLRDQHGHLRSTDDLARDVVDGLSRMEDPTRAGAIAMQLMGEQGARLIPAFRDGAESLEAARRELEALGGGMSQEAIDAAAELTAEQQRLSTAVLGVKSRIAVYLLPALSRLVDFATGATAAFSRMADRGRILETAFVALGVAGAAAGARTIAAWAAAAAPFIGVAAAVGVAILVFEDLWVGVEGGRSAIGALAEDMEAWALDWSLEGGLMSGVVMAFEYLKGLIASYVNTLSQMASAIGLGGPAGGILGDAAESVGREGDQESQLAGALAARRREEGGALGDFLTPDTFERFLAVQEARSMIARGTVPADLRGLVPNGAAPAVTQTVRIDRIDASGMTPAQATAVVESAVQRALAAQSEDTAEALAQDGG